MSFYITHSGVKVYPAKIDETTIYLEDIAHHLSNIQRFGGSLPLDVNYSVAQHSILMAEYAQSIFGDPELSAACLLHDASEAYLGDIVTSLKAVLPEYKSLETHLTTLIENKYKLLEYKDTVHRLDKCILLDEVLELMPNRYALFRSLNPGLAPLGVEIDKYASKFAIKERFLALCDELEIYDEEVCHG